MNGSRIVRVTSLNFKKVGEAYHDEFSMYDMRLAGGGWFGDYVKAVIKSIMDHGHRVRGMDIMIWSEVR